VGNHSLCKPDAFCRTGSVGESPLSAAGSYVNVGLGQRGQELWNLARPSVAGPLKLALLLEACRIADRLDTMDRQLQGKGEAWLRFRNRESGDEVTVYVDRVLAEAREQAMAFRMCVAELSKSAAQAPAESTGGGGIADLTARIAARRASPAG
jgi:hypothetical protein